MRKIDSQYKDLYRFIMQQGLEKGDRTGVGTTSALAGHMRFDVRGGLLPVMSLREIKPEKFIHEMLWFVSGSSSIKYLKDNKVGVWDSWFIKGTDVYEDSLYQRPMYEMLVEFWALKHNEKEANRETCGALETETGLRRLGDVGFCMGLEFGAKPVCTDYTKQECEKLSLVEQEEIRKVMKLAGLGTMVENSIKPVSLQTRLNRIPKEDVEKWDAVIHLIDQATEFKDPLVEHVVKGGEYTVFRKGEFVKVGLSALHAAAVWQLLDELQVPAYKLIDADIGQGAYGPQWRKWQDTQIVDDSEVSAYDARGYEFKGHLASLGADGIVQSVMHREIDQLQDAINLLKNDPDSRRIIISAWNPGRIWQAALPPCHNYFQFVSYEKDLRDYEEDFARLDLTGDYIQSFKDEALKLEEGADTETLFLEWAKEFAAEKGVPTRWLSMVLLLRSSDTGAGIGFNTPQYVVLLNMVASVVNMDPREFFVVGVDSHLYTNQMEIVDDLIYKDSPDDHPRLAIKRKVDSIDDFTIDDFEVTGYNPLPNEKVMPIAR